MIQVERSSSRGERAYIVYTETLEDDVLFADFFKALDRRGYDEVTTAIDKLLNPDRFREVE